MDLEEELLAFLETAKRPTSLKLDGTPRKEREADPTIRQRNLEIVLSHFGFGAGEDVWPTLEQLAERYDALTRERIRQIIERTYTDHLPSAPLPLAAAASRVLSERDLWMEGELLIALKGHGLIGELEHSVGLLSYLHSQGLATDFEVYLASLQPATRSTYLSGAGHLVGTAARIAAVSRDLKVAQILPGKAGLAKLSNVKRRGARVDHQALGRLVTLAGNTWSGTWGGELWYSFEDRENVLVNEASKTFAVVDRCRIGDLAMLLAQALLKRSAPDEYPPVDLIRTWITQSIHFTVEDGLATFNGEIADLNPIEKGIVKVARGRIGAPVKSLSEKLVAKGFGSDNVTKNLYASPFLLVDRSGGRGHYTGTLVSDLGRDPIAPTNDYEKFLARLAALGGTDRESAGTTRREQSILRDWIFRRAEVGECAACGRVFARGALVVAHKKKRFRCTDTERLDPHIVFPLCTFGCDHLYENGYITVREGRLCAGRPTLGKTEAEAVSALNGKAIPSRWLAGPDVYFDNLEQGGG
jgi:hypothetical protein